MDEEIPTLPQALLRFVIELVKLPFRLINLAFVFLKVLWRERPWHAA